MAETLAVALRADLAEVRDTGVASVRRQYIWDTQGNKILVGDIWECLEKIARPHAGDRGAGSQRHHADRTAAAQHQNSGEINQSSNSV